MTCSPIEFLGVALRMLQWMLASCLLIAMPASLSAQGIRWDWSEVDKYDLPAQNQLVLEAVASRSRYNRAFYDLYDDGRFAPGAVDDVSLKNFRSIWWRDFKTLYDGGAQQHFRVVENWQEMQVKRLTGSLFHLELPIAPTFQNQPCPGDIIRLRHNGTTMVMVWAGNGYFPHLQSKEAHLTSFFFYPFLSTYPVKKSNLGLQRNTWPPRINNSLADYLTENLDNFPDVPANGFSSKGWLTASLTTPQGGAYGKFYVPIKQWESSAGFRYQVLRRRGCYRDFDSEARRRQTDRDLRFALEIAGRCHEALNVVGGPHETRVRELLRKCFNWSVGQTARRARVARTFKQFRQLMAHCCISYAPGYLDGDIQAGLEDVLGDEYPRLRIERARPDKQNPNVAVIVVRGLNDTRWDVLRNDSSARQRALAELRRQGYDVTQVRFVRGTFSAFVSPDAKFVLFLGTNHFKNGNYRRATTIIHEFCHAAGISPGHPGTGRYGRHSSLIRSRYQDDISGPLGASIEHPMLEIQGAGDDAEVVGRLQWQQASRNAYAYANFALWFAQTEM